MYSWIKYEVVFIAKYAAIVSSKIVCSYAFALEKEVVTYSSILVWRIPWTEEPGRLQSMRSQKSQTQLSD